jgi:dolichol-phosphate mannosyltransferase
MSRELSVVVPVYGCRGSLAALHERLTCVLTSLGVDYELVLVDDRSPDGVWEDLRALAHEDPHVRSVRLSRNFGQHAALTAGLGHATGRFVVVMDCDLQDRPEEIPRLYNKALEGYDIVLAKRKGRSQSLLRRVAARAYFRLMNVFLRTSFDGEYGSFSIISKKVVESYLRINDKARHYLFVLHWLGYEHTDIDVEHADREVGKSSYSFPKLVRHAFDGVLFQTTVLLRWIVYLGFALATCGAVLAVIFAVVFFVATPPPGWTSLGVLLLLIGGFVTTSLGVTGLYIGQIFEQVKGRPLYVVDEVAGAEVPAHEPAVTES